MISIITLALIGLTYVGGKALIDVLFMLIHDTTSVAYMQDMTWLIRNYKIIGRVVYMHIVVIDRGYIPMDTLKYTQVLNAPCCDMWCVKLPFCKMTKCHVDSSVNVHSWYLKGDEVIECN